MVLLYVIHMDSSIYRELQAAAERAYPFADGPAWEILSRMQDELDTLLPPSCTAASAACATSPMPRRPSTARPVSGSGCIAALC